MSFFSRKRFDSSLRGCTLEQTVSHKKHRQQVLSLNLCCVFWTPPTVKSHFSAASRQTDERYSQIPHHPEHTRGQENTSLIPAFAGNKAVV